MSAWCLKRAAIEVLADIATEKSVPALMRVLASTDTHEVFHLRKPAEDAMAAIGKRQKR